MKTQFNKSEIFKAAWSIVRTSAKSISEALKAAWASVKTPLTETALKLKDLGVNNYSEVASQLEKIYGADFSIWSNYGKVRAYIEFSGTNKNKKTFIDLTTGKVTYDHAWSLVNSALKNTSFNY